MGTHTYTSQRYPWPPLADMACLLEQLSHSAEHQVCADEALVCFMEALVCLVEAAACFMEELFFFMVKLSSERVCWWPLAAFTPRGAASAVGRQTSVMFVWRLIG